MSFDILKKELKENKLQNVYLFYGQEDYLIKYYMNAIGNLIVDEETKDLNYIYLEGKKDTNTLIENCETMPVFCDKKLVISRNSGYFKSKKGGGEGSDKKSENNKLADYIENMPPYTCLIFVEQEVDKRIKLVNTIKKKGLVVEFDYQKPADLVKWVVKVFKSHKKTIDTIAASYIVENSEYSMVELLNEIDKIVNFTGEIQNISIDDVKSVCTTTIKSRIFDLTDAVAEGNISKALMLLNDMAFLKEPMQKIMYMIVRQIRMVYRMKLLKQQGMREDAAAKQMGLTPFVASKVLGLSRNMEIGVLEKAMYYSLELDESVKTGKMTDRTAIELLIVSMK
ncbi:DNA polymerase III, delta subunit [Ruminiclostridium papyrosolvens DSM 2782]|uniref:DNA polymerase III subunit delta n=1 Tax=Ruminiclostridium papyrosolvens DSM 2782 TaxID=588581 RepID=F1TAH2_9FIRM|nr:DNA polymerase III subunit delta [Ruminiclostridium papyrosolvens]EGD48515.1 DNA polymerase III, delta subunit [Ruminiclostridium papyrosolvens DSM 2782]WES32727.1 DNA polymerase III subunit delta [Ruminiclostridium papyrosolvens DSM 2782]